MSNMKIIILSFFSVLLTVLSGGVLQSQTSVVARSPHFSHATKVIIKELSYPSTITCANSGTDSVTFIYSDASLQSNEIIITGYFVNDITIVKDTLFFCGRTVGNERAETGIFGFFKFDAGFNNISNVYIYDNILAGVPYLKVVELTRMQNFISSSGDRHLACVGMCDRKYPCLIDFYRWPTGWYYAGGNILDENESLTDVKITQNAMGINKLVTAGFDDSYGRHVCLRIYDPDLVFTPSGMQDTRFTFCDDPYTEYDWHGDEVLLSPVENNIFATASHKKAEVYVHNANNRTDVFSELQVSFYKVSALTSSSVYSMIKTASVLLPENSYRSINQFVKRRNDRSLVLLHTITPAFSSIKSTFCEIDYPLPSDNGYWRAYSYADNILQGLTSYDWGHKYAMSGYSLYNNTVLKYEMETFGTASNCAERQEYEYFDIKTIPSVNHNVPFVSMLGVVKWKQLEFKQRRVSISIDCGAQ